jgi:hypothetical protein
LRTPPGCAIGGARDPILRAPRASTSRTAPGFRHHRRPSLLRAQSASDSDTVGFGQHHEEDGEQVGWVTRCRLIGLRVDHCGQHGLQARTAHQRSRLTQWSVPGLRRPCRRPKGSPSRFDHLSEAAPGGWPTSTKLTERHPLPATGARKEAAPSDAHRRQGSKAPKTASLFGLAQGRRGREADEG